MKTEIKPSELSYEGNDIVEITYSKTSRYKLGTKPVSINEFLEIEELVAKRKLIGIHVWSYVHSGSMIRASDNNPFTCQFDSGLSGIAYMSTESALIEFGSGSKRLTSKIKEKAIQYCIDVVREFSSYLEGDVWDIIVTDDDGRLVESICGIVGHDNAKEESEELIKEYSNVISA